MQRFFHRLVAFAGLRVPLRCDYLFDAARRVAALVFQRNTACA